MPSIATSDFLTKAEQFPLAASETTKRGMADFEPGAGNNLYFGTGLSTTKAVTRGLPFDFLGMVIGAEFTRRELGIDKIIHEISDTHAIENNVAAPGEIRRLAAEQRDLVATMTSNLGLDRVYECTLASEYQPTEAYQRLLGQVKAKAPDENHYFQYQWAGMAYLAEQRGVGVKVGWLTDDKPDAPPRGFDERTFDQGYDQLAMKPLSYTYLKSGRNFEPSRTRVSPYTSVEGEDRIMLKQGEDAMSYLKRWAIDQAPSKDTRKTVMHLAAVVEGFEEMFGPVRGTDPIWTEARENRAAGIMAPPAAPGLTRNIDLQKLALKINGIMEDVFELRGPVAPVPSFETRERTRPLLALTPAGSWA